MRRILPAVTATVLAASALWAAGGTPAPSEDPADQAAQAYERGTRHRDRALELESEAAETDGERREKKLAKATDAWEQAARAYRTAVDEDPELHRAHSDLGFALRKLGDYEASLAAYDRALALAPGYGEAIEYRGEAYLKLGRLEEVQDAYMELFRSDRELADELMGAIRTWLDERAGDPGDLDPAALQDFSVWAEERARAAEQTADLGTASAERTW